MLPLGQRACSRRIHNVIVLAYPSHSLITNKGVFVISEQTNSTIAHDFNVSLVSNNLLSKLQFKLLEACFRHREVCCIREPLLTIIIGFLHDIVNYILSWRWDDIIQSNVAAATMPIGLCTSGRVGCLCRWCYSYISVIILDRSIILTGILNSESQIITRMSVSHQLSSFVYWLVTSSWCDLCIKRSTTVIGPRAGMMCIILDRCGHRISIFNGYTLSIGNLIPSPRTNNYSLKLQWLIS